MYGRNLRLFAGIGVIFIPIAIVVAGLQAGLFLLTDLESFSDVAGESSSAVATFVFGIALLFDLVGLGLVQGVVACAMLALDEDRPITPWSAYRDVLGRRPAILAAVVLIVIVILPLTLSFFLIPIAVWLIVRWSLTSQALIVEGLGARAALRRSFELVRGRWWRTALPVVGVGVVATIIGPFIGALALLGTDAAFWVANLISATVYVFAFPFAAVVTTYVYYDHVVRKDLEPDFTTTPLPPESSSPPSKADRKPGNASRARLS